MWPDERYAKVTQKDINEAKVRHAVREKARKEKESHAPHHDDHHGHHDHEHLGAEIKKPTDPTKTHTHPFPAPYDFKHVAVKQPKELYP